MEDTYNGEENGSNNVTHRENINGQRAHEAMELRAIHAALMQSNSKSPAKTRSGFVASTVSTSSHDLCSFTAQDYPVFTPSYEDDPYHQMMMGNNRNYAESWGEHNLHGSSIEGHICPLLDEDRNSTTGSFTNNLKAALRASSSPVPNYSKSRRNSLGDANSVSSCNKCKPKPPMIMSSESETTSKNVKKPNIIVPLTDSHLSLRKSHQSNKGLGFSRLFPMLKKKHKNKDKNEDLSRGNMFVSIEALERELIEANESRVLALTEVSEMKSSLGELRQKLEYLESYCEELKNALRQAVQLNINSQPGERLSKIPNSENSTEDYTIPVTEQVMVEGFLQIVSEARLSVKQLCKALLGQIDEIDRTNLNLLLRPHKLSLDSKHSKTVQHHVESIINQSLYQDFENRVFQRNGSSKVLDLNQERLHRFQSFATLRNLSWNEVLRKGTKYYSEELSKFCDTKMNAVITSLVWAKPWTEHMLKGFFLAAKCVWLLHLLAFSFDPPLGILRVDENTMFEGNYMEDVCCDRQRSQQGPSRVKVMVMPGFYVLDRVVKCKVLCRHRQAFVS